jgi:hypothetical protein
MMVICRSLRPDQPDDLLGPASVALLTECLQRRESDAVAVLLKMAADEMIVVEPD